MLWLLRILNMCMDIGTVPEDWKVDCVFPVYKGRGNRSEYVSYKGCSILGIPSNL